MEGLKFRTRRKILSTIITESFINSILKIKM